LDQAAVGDHSSSARPRPQPNQPPGPTVREGLAWTSAPAPYGETLGKSRGAREACVCAAGRRRRSRHAGGAWVAVKVSGSHGLSPPSLPARVAPAQGKRSSGASHPSHSQAGQPGLRVVAAVVNWWLELDQRRRLAGPRFHAGVPHVDVVKPLGKRPVVYQ